MALDYDEDDIGDLSEEDDADRRGDKELDSYTSVLDNFLLSSGTGIPVDPSEVSPFPYSTHMLCSNMLIVSSLYRFFMPVCVCA